MPYCYPKRGFHTSFNVLRTTSAELTPSQGLGYRAEHCTSNRFFDLQNVKWFSTPFHCTKFSHECSPTFKTTSRPNQKEGKEKETQVNNHSFHLQKPTKCHQRIPVPIQKSAIRIKDLSQFCVLHILT